MDISNENFTLSKMISERRSTLAFSKKPIEGPKIHQLFEAARWAPSSYNEQPWRFIYGLQEEPDSFVKLFDCLTDGNKEWVKDAQMLVLSIAKTNFSMNDQSNFYARHDVGLATQNLMLQAVHMGLVVHPMGGFDKKKAAEVLAIPSGYEPVAMIAVGYPGEAENLPEHLLKREKSERLRKPQSEIVFKGKWD